MISQTAEYALRAAVFLAEHGEHRWTTQQIAELTQVPAGYLAKVMQNLARAGLVESQRGVHGGFNLLRSPEEISILEVLEAVDPPQRIRECPLHLKSHKDRLCPLHERLDETMAMIEDAFRRSTLAELLVRPTFPTTS